MRIHFAGGGQCAEYIAKRLIREGHELIVVEMDERRCSQLEKNLDAQILHGDIAHLSTWREAELDKTDMFVACTHSDAANVSACLIAHHLAADAYKLVRLRGPDFNDWNQIFENLGVRVDRIVHPETDIVNRVLKVLDIPGVADVRDFLQGHAKVFSMNINRHHHFVNLKVDELSRLKDGDSSHVCLILKGTQAIVPTGNEKIEADDHLYIATPSSCLEKTLKFYGINRRERIRSVFITGGGEIALSIARQLENQKVLVKLFEVNEQRAEYLAEELERTVILNLSGTDQEMLQRENIESADAYLALTDDDDDNLIACLLARRLGVEKVVPMLNRINYLPLAQRLGINTTVSPRIKSADALLEFIRMGEVQSVRTLGEEQAEAIELTARPEAFFTGRPLGSVKFPAGVRVAFWGTANGEVHIPGPHDVIQAGDKLVLFAQEGAINKLESSITHDNRKQS